MSTTAPCFPIDFRTTFTGIGLLMHVTFATPLASPRDAAAIAHTTLHLRRPDLDLARFDWTDAVVQLSAGSGRYSVHVKYRREGAAAVSARPRLRLCPSPRATKEEVHP